MPSQPGSGGPGMLDGKMRDQATAVDMLGASSALSSSASGDHNRRVHVNAMSTRIRRFGAVWHGESRSLAASVGMEIA